MENQKTEYTKGFESGMETMNALFASYDQCYKDGYKTGYWKGYKVALGGTILGFFIGSVLKAYKEDQNISK